MARRFYGRRYNIRKVYNFRGRGGRRFYRRGNGGRMRIIANPIYWGGVAFGAFSTLDDKNAELVRAVATMPIRGGSMVGMLKSAAQGAVFGEAATSLMGINSKTESVGGKFVGKLRSAF